MYEYFLEKKKGNNWKTVLTLELSSERMTSGKIDKLYRHKTKKEMLVIHVDELGSSRVSDYYISYDEGDEWFSAYYENEPDEKEYDREDL